MLCIPSFMLSNSYPLHITTTATTNTFHFSPWTCIQCPTLVHHRVKPPRSFPQLAVSVLEEDSGIDKEENSKIKWYNIGTDITESQKDAIARLPPKMTNRRKALMKRLICFSEDENLLLLLASWVKVMKPNRADWLAIIKEMKRLENPLLFEVMEYALVEDSFEANIRDYTKLIDTYAKRNFREKAERTYLSMKSRGFPCDQVALTVMIQMYSKAGDVDRAAEMFEEIKSLGLPTDRRSYGSMMMAYIRAGKPELAEALMGEMEERETYAGREVYKALLRAYSSAGDAAGAQRVFESVQFAGVVPDDRLCALLVNAYCAAGMSDEARCVVENMRRAGVAPGDKCVALVLGAYEREEKLERAMGFLMDLEEDGLLVGEEGSKVLARWFRRIGVVHEVEHVLREFSIQDPRIKKRSFSMNQGRVWRGPLPVFLK